MSLIGREIVQALQGGEERTGYGGRQLAELSDIAAAAVRAGVSVTNLKYFRLFFPAYANRSPEIRHKPCDKFSELGQAGVLQRTGRTLPAKCHQIHFLDTFTHLQTIRPAMTDNLFSICEPRPDVLQGALRESDFAADLSQVLRGDAPDEYKRPELFFANTYPTKGLKNALKLVALRVLGRPEQVGAVFRLDTQFGYRRRRRLTPDGLRLISGRSKTLRPFYCANFEVA